MSFYGGKISKKSGIAILISASFARVKCFIYLRIRVFEYLYSAFEYLGFEDSRIRGFEDMRIRGFEIGVLM